jgi:5'-nucleotidase / UDP-sugar diphosphatase
MRAHRRLTCLLQDPTFSSVLRMPHADTPRRRGALTRRIRNASACAALAAVALAAALGAGQVRTDAAGGELRFTIIHTSDEHAALLPSPLVEYRPGEADRARGGFARLASLVEAVRAENAATGEPVLLTSAGDFMSGTPFSWLLLEGEAPELTLMAALGYDVVTLGNHEFDFGSERLAEYLETAGFPNAAGRTAIVATNARPPAGHPLADRGIRRTHLVTLANGLRVGFVGLLGEGAARYAPAAAPVAFADAQEAAAEGVAALRRQGAQVVIAVTHSGLAEDRALVRAVPGIDLVLGGHDHLLPDELLAEAGTPIVHAGEYLQQAARLELAFDPDGGGLRIRNAEAGVPWLVPLDHSVPESPWMAARVEAYRGQVEERLRDLTGGRVGDLGQTVARSGFTVPATPRIGEMPMGGFVADAMRAAAAAATGTPVDVAFQASGQIRGDLVPGASDWNRGAVSAYDLASTVGLGTGPDGAPGYPMVSVWLTGDEVRRVLEVSVLLSGLMGSSYFLQVSGLEARYDPRRAVLGRIPVRGTPIPTGRAVLSAERVGDDGGRGPLSRGDTTLYHVVTDRYVASFLPMVGRVVPRFLVEPKTRDGSPIADLDDAIVRRDGRELKVWQAVLEHAGAQPAGPGGEPWIAERYAAPEGRLVATRGVPLWLLPAVAAALLLTLPAVLIVRRRRARLHATASAGARQRTESAAAGAA